VKRTKQDIINQLHNDLTFRNEQLQMQKNYASDLLKQKQDLMNEINDLRMLVGALLLRVTSTHSLTFIKKESKNV
jgi:hypothetical protein